MIAYTLCPSKSDATFQIVFFIATRLIMFESHFHHSYYMYYLIDVSDANYRKIRSTYSEIQKFKNMNCKIPSFDMRICVQEYPSYTDP